jgi:hypothetical protein
MPTFQEVAGSAQNPMLLLTQVCEDDESLQEVTIIPQAEEELEVDLDEEDNDNDMEEEQDCTVTVGTTTNQEKGKVQDILDDLEIDVKALGEDIQWDPYGGLYRVRDLSLSRAIGDKFAKPIVTAEAEIRHYPVANGDDEFILLASDGLWDVMSSQEAIDFVHESLRYSSGKDVETLRKKMALNVAVEALERGSADNVCVLVVWLGDHDEKK